MIRSCIPVFYFVGLIAATQRAAVAGTCGHDAPSEAQAPNHPDELYRHRDVADYANRAATIWSARLATNAADFESAWKLARAQYWLGTNGLPARSRRAALEAGIVAARTATAIRADRPEGYLWLAANMGALAELSGLRNGLKYRGAIRDALETVRRLDPAFQQGSADRALGRWYFKVPRLLGGDRKKSEAHLRKALTYNQHSVITHLYLGETLLGLGRKAEARNELEAAVAAPEDPEWAPEDRQFREQARRLLSTLR